jgi:Leucine-rich repeat (LRR) protein
MRFKSKLKLVLLTACVVLAVFGLAGIGRLMMLKNSQTYYDDLAEALDNSERAETLVMRNRGMKALPPAIGNLTHLKILNIGNNDLRDLPVEIGQLVNLEELSMENNMLTGLPKELFLLTKLKRINLCHNQIENFPSVLPLSIEEIYLCSNRLTLIPKQIKGLKQLRIIDLAENQIVEIPWNVVFPDSVRKIDLYHNMLARATPSLFSLFALKELILEENPLDEKTETLYKKFKHH